MLACGKTGWFYWDSEAGGLGHHKRDLRWKVERWKGGVEKLQQQKGRSQQRDWLKECLKRTDQAGWGQTKTAPPGKRNSRSSMQHPELMRQQLLGKDESFEEDSSHFSEHKVNREV